MKRSRYWDAELRQALCRFYSRLPDRETRIRALGVFRESRGNLTYIVLGLLPLFDAADRRGIVRAIRRH